MFSVYSRQNCLNDFIMFDLFFLLIQNQRSNAQVGEARPPPRFSKKVFQSNCNVAAAGDPRAKLGSYSQAYGTINKTELDNLLRNRPYNH